MIKAVEVCGVCGCAFKAPHGSMHFGEAPVCFSCGGAILTTWFYMGWLDSKVYAGSEV